MNKQIECVEVSEESDMYDITDVFDYLQTLAYKNNKKNERHLRNIGRIKELLAENGVSDLSAIEFRTNDKLLKYIHTELTEKYIILKTPSKKTFKIKNTHNSYRALLCFHYKRINTNATIEELMEFSGYDKPEYVQNALLRVVTWCKRDKYPETFRESK